MTNGSARYRASAAAHAVALDDEVLIWDARGVQLHRLNPSASSVWLALTTGQSADEIVDALSTSFGVDAAQVHEDVIACIADLARAGLVEQRPERSGA
jgi:hypothetical protein